MFTVSDKPIDTLALRDELQNGQAGALVSFEGWVRDHNDGQHVVALEYEAYGTLAEREGERLLQEAVEHFDVLAARCEHRTGKLKIGETAVWIGVISAHRKAAFQACEYIIAEIKKRVPIWKKEHYVDGPSEWVRSESESESAG